MKLFGDGLVAFTFNLDIYNLLSEPLRQRWYFISMLVFSVEHTTIPIYTMAP